MSGLNTVVNALKVSEGAIRTASKNVSNVNTEGYKRQRIVQYEMVGGSQALGHQIGMGARIDRIEQVYNTLKEEAYQESLAKLGEFDTENEIYTYIQSIVGVTNTDKTTITDAQKGVFEAALENIWSAANTLATDPSSLTYRMSFQESIISFLTETETVMDKLDSLQEEINVEIGNVVNKINTLAKEISELNERINTSSAIGRDITDLKDKRSSVIEELSKYVEIDLEQYPDTETVMVRIDGGFLVTNTDVNKIELAQNQASSIYDIPVWSNTKQPVNVTSGELKGLLDTRGYNIVGNLTDPTNGSPREQADIVISIDNAMQDTEKLNEIMNQIDAMVGKLDANSTNYRIYIDTGAGITQGFDNAQDVKNALQGYAVSGNILNSVINMDTTQLREKSNKYLMVFSDNALTGTQAQLNTSIAKMQELGMRVIAVTNNQDQIVADSWRTLTNVTEGSIYSLDSELEDIGNSLAYNVNSRLEDQEYDGIIAKVKAQLSTLVSVFTRSMNEVFSNGINAYGEQNTDGDLDIFLKINENLPWQIGNIKLNSEFSDLNKLPLSMSGDIGDNRLVEEFVELRDRNIFNDSNISLNIDSYYEKFIFDLGTDAKEVHTSLANQEIVVKDADNARKAVSGVSLDEELANIIKFQYAYTGASRMLTVLDEMMEVVQQLV